MAPNWDLSDVFLMMASELHVFRRKTTEAKCHFSSYPYAGCLLPAWLIIGDVNFGHLPEVMCTIFVYSKGSPHPILVLFGKEVTQYSPHWGAGSYVAPLGGRSAYTNCSEFLNSSAWEICLFQFIYSINHLLKIDNNIG